MLDTHAVARSLTDARFTEAQADAITTAVRLWPRNMATTSTTDRFEAGRVGCPGNRACPGLPGRAVNARTGRLWRSCRASDRFHAPGGGQSCLPFLVFSAK